MDLRDVRHTMTSDAFLIKSGFPPATGAQIKGVGGGRWHCCREVLSGLVTRAQQQWRHVFLTCCDVRLHSGKRDFPPCRLLLSFLRASLSRVALQAADIFERFTILFYILSSIGDKKKREHFSSKLFFSSNGKIIIPTCCEVKLKK